MQCPVCKAVYTDPIFQCARCHNRLSENQSSGQPPRFNWKVMIIVVLAGLLLLGERSFLLSLIAGILAGFIFKKPPVPVSVLSLVQEIKVERCPLCDTQVSTSLKACPGCKALLNFPLLEELSRLQYLIQEIEKWHNQALIDQNLLSILKRPYEARKEEILATIRPSSRVSQQPTSSQGFQAPEEEPKPSEVTLEVPVSNPESLTSSQVLLTSEVESQSPESDQLVIFKKEESEPPEVEIEFPAPITNSQLVDDMVDIGQSPPGITLSEEVPEIDRQVERESGWVRLMQAFLDEKNIKWLGALGALGVVISSMVLVSRYWDQFPTFLRYFLMIAYTTGFYGLAVMTIHKLGLEKTGNTLLVITSFLIPLNFIYLERLGVLNGLGGLIIFVIGTGVLTFLSYVTVKELLGEVSLYHLFTFIFLSVVNVLLPAFNLQDPPMSIFMAFFLWLVAFGGVDTAIRFYLKEQTILRKRYTFFVASMILYVYILGLIMTLQVPFSWYGLILMLVSIPLIRTAHALGRIFQEKQSSNLLFYNRPRTFRQSSGQIADHRPLPPAVLIPYLVGYGLSLLAYLFALQNAYALFFTALLGLGAYGISAYQHKRRFFAYLTMISLGIVYFYSPIFFEEVALRFRDTAATQLGYQRLPYPFYGLTFIPFNIVLIGIGRWLNRKNEKVLARCFYRVGVPLSVLLVILSCFELKALVMVSIIYVGLYGIAAYLFNQRLLLYPSILCAVLWVLSLTLLLPIPPTYRGITFAMLGLVWLGLGFLSQSVMLFRAFSEDSKTSTTKKINLLSQINPFPVMAMVTSLLALFFQILSTFPFTGPIPFLPVASLQGVITALLLSVLYGATSWIFLSPFLVYVASLSLSIALFSILFVLQVPATTLSLFSALYSLIFWGVGYSLACKFQLTQNTSASISKARQNPLDSFIFRATLAFYQSACVLSGMTLILSITWGKAPYLPALALFLTALLYFFVASQFGYSFWKYLTVITASLAVYGGILNKLPLGYRTSGFAALGIVWTVLGYGLTRLDPLLEKLRIDRDYLPPLIRTASVLTGYATLLYINQLFLVGFNQGFPMTAFSIALSFFLLAIFFQMEVLLYPAIFIASAGIYLGWVSRFATSYHFLMLTLLACLWGFAGWWSREGVGLWSRKVVKENSPLTSSAHHLISSPPHHVSLGMLAILLIIQVFWAFETIFFPVRISTVFWGAQLMATGLLGVAYLAYFRIYSSVTFLYFSLSAFSLILPWTVSLLSRGDRSVALTSEIFVSLHGGAILLTAFVWLGIYHILSHERKARQLSLFLSVPLSEMSIYLSPFRQFSIFLSLGALLITLPIINLISASVIFLVGVLHLVWGIRIQQTNWVYSARIWITLSFYYFLIAWIAPELRTFEQLSFNRLLPILAPMGFLSLLLACFWFSIGRKTEEGSRLFGLTTKSFYTASIILSILAGLCIELSTLDREISRLDLTLSLVTLGLVAALLFWLAHILQYGWLVYMGGFCLLGFYGYLRMTDVIQNPSWDRVIPVGLGFFLFWVHGKTHEYQLRVFQQPTSVTSLFLSFIALLLSLWTINFLSVPVILLVGGLHLLWGIQTDQNRWVYSSGVWFTLGFYYFLIAWMAPDIQTLDQLSFNRLLPILAPMGFLSLLLACFWFNLGRKAGDSQIFGLKARSFYRISLFLSVLAAWCVGLSTLAEEVFIFDLILGILTLGLVAVLHFWLAHILQREGIVYLGELTLASLYGYLKVTEVIEVLFWGKVVMIGLSFFLLWVNIKTHQFRLRVFQRPTYLTSLILPAISVILAVVHSFSGQSFYDQITGVNPVLIACAASYYALVAFQRKNKEFGYLAAILYDGAMFLLWTDLKFTDLQFYLIPLGLTIIFVAQINKDQLGRENLAYLRSFGSLIIYASPAWAIVTGGSDRHALSLAILSFLGITVGIALRIRAFLYLGTIFLVMDLVAQVVIQSYHSSLFKWLCILTTGLLIIFLAAFFERKREVVLRKIKALAEIFETWE